MRNKDNPPQIVNLDYTGFHLLGYSTQKIDNLIAKRQLANPGTKYNIGLLPYDQAKEKYISDGLITEENFDKAWSNIESGYDSYKQNEFNSFVADAWQYHPGTAIYNSPSYLDGFVDLTSEYSDKSGVDLQGRPIISQKRLAERRGFYYDLEGNKKTIDTTAFGRGLRSLADFFEEAVIPLALSGGDPIAAKSMRDMYSDLVGHEEGLIKGGSLFAIGHDTDGPVYHEIKMTDVVEQSRIRRILGPEPMTRDGIGSFAKSFYNFIPQLFSVAGTTLQMADNLMDKMVYGGLTETETDKIANALQNFGGQFTFGRSEAAGAKGIFESKETLLWELGNLTAQMLSVVTLAGVLRAASVAPKLARNISFGAFGLLGADAMNQTGKEMHIPKEDLAWMVPIAGGIEGGTEMLGANFLFMPVEAVGIRSAMRKLIKKEGAALVKEFGVKSVKELPRAAKKKLMGRILKGFRKIGGGLGTKRGLIGGAAIEEGSEEVVAGLAQNFMTTMYDLHTAVVDPTKSPGDGMFGPVYLDSYYNTFLQRIPEGVSEGFVLGALAGGAMASGRIGYDAMTLSKAEWKKRYQDKSFAHYAVMGKSEIFHKVATDMHEKGDLNYNHLDKDGNIIPINQIGEVQSLNDLVYQDITERINYWDKLATQLNVKNAGLLNEIGGDFDLAREALQQYDIIVKAEEAIKELSQQPDSKENQNQINVLNTNIQNARKELSYYLDKEITQYNKDNPDQQFSRYYNDKVKNAIVDRYSGLEGGSYSNFLKVYSDQFEKYKTDNVAEYEKRAEERETGLADITGRITELSKFTEIEDPIKALEALSGEIASIVTDVEKFGTKPEISEAFKPMFDQVISDIVGEHGERLRAAEELDFEAEGYETKYDELLAGIEDLSSAYRMTRGAGETAADIFAKPYEVDQLYDFFVDRPRKLLNKIKGEIVSSQMRGQTEKGMMVKMGILGTMLTESQNATALNYHVLNKQFASKDDMRGHLSENDIVLNEEQYERMSGELRELNKEHSELIFQLEKALGASQLIQMKVRTGLAEMDRMALGQVAIVIPDDLKIKNSDNKLIDEINALTALDKSEVQDNRFLSEENDAILLERETKLLELSEQVYLNRAKIFTKAKIKTMLENNFVRQGKNPFYFETNDNSRAHADLILEITDRNYTTRVGNNIAYTHFINSLIRLSSINLRTLNEVRLDIFPKADIIEGEKIRYASTIEQMRPEDEQVAFHRDSRGRQMMERIFEVEQEILGKDKEGDEVGLTKSEIKTRIDLHISNASALRGFLGVGKSKQMASNVIRLLKAYNDVDSNPKKKILKRIALIGLSNENLQDLKDVFPEGLGLEIVPLLTSDVFAGKLPKDVDFVLWDEAYTIPDDNIKDLKKIFSNDYSVMFLGDESQMVSSRNETTWSRIKHIGFKSSPVVDRFSTGVPVINDYMNTWLDHYHEKPKEPTLLYAENNPEGEGLMGGKYYLEEGMLSAFSESKVQKALVFLNREAFEKFKKNNENFVLEHFDNISILELDITKPTPKGVPETIQALRRMEIYLMFDPYLHSPISASRMGYTGAGRASNFIGVLAGSLSGNTTKDKIKWLDHPHEKVSPESRIGDINTNRTRLENILGKKVTSPKVLDEKSQDVSDKGADQTDSVMTVAEMDEYNITNGEYKNRRILITDVDPKRSGICTGRLMIRSEDGKTWENTDDIIIDIPIEHLGIITNETKLDDNIKYDYDLVNSNSYNLGEQFLSKESGQSFYIVAFASKMVNGKDVVIGVLLNDENVYSFKDLRNKFISTPEYVDDINDEDDIARFSEQGLKYDENKQLIWAQSYSVVQPGGGELSESEIEKVRKMHVVMHGSLSDFNYEYDYIGTATVSSNEEGTITKENILVLRANLKSERSEAFDSVLKTKGEIDSVFNTIRKEIKDNGGILPIRYSLFQVLKDTEFAYKKNGKNQIIEGLDYANDVDFTKILDKIKYGFRLAGDKSINQRNKAVNKRLAQLRRKGALMQKGTGDHYTKVADASGSFGLEFHEGRLIFDSDKVDLSFIQLKDKLVGKDITIEARPKYRKVNKVNQLTTVYKHGTSIEDADTRVLIGFYSKLVGDVSGDYLEAKLKDDLEKINILKGDQDAVNLSNQVRDIFLVQLVRNNTSIIKDNANLLNFFKAYFEFTSEYVNIKGNWYTTLSELHSAINSAENINIRSEVKDVLHAPVMIDPATGIVLESELDLLYTKVQDVNFPYTYVDVTHINTETTEIDTGVTDIAQIKTKEKKPIEDEGYFHLVESGDFYDYTFEDVRDVENYIVDVLGEDFLANRTDFEVIPQVKSGMYIFGRMVNGRIKYDISRGGVETTSIRHEILHVVWNYYLSEKERSRLSKEVINAYNLNDVQSKDFKYIEELLAKKFGATGTTKFVQQQKKTRSKILTAFYNFLDKIFGRWMKNKSAINNLFERIDNGYYQNRVINLPVTSDITRNNEVRIPYDGEYVGFHDLQKVFGSPTTVYDIRRMLQSNIILYSPYLNRTDTNRSISMADAIRVVESKYGDDYYLKEALRMARGINKMIKNVLPSELHLLDNDEILVYNQYKLYEGVKDSSKPNYYRIIVQDIFPGYSFSQSRFKKHSSDSIITNYNEINWDTTRDDTYDAIMETIRYRQFEYIDGNFVFVKDEDGNSLRWSKKKFVNLSDLHASLREAGQEVDKRLNRRSQTADALSYLTDELFKVAKKFGNDSEKANNIVSFIHSFLQTIPKDIDIPGYGTSKQWEIKALREVVADLGRSKDNTKRRRKEKLEALLNQIVVEATSLRRRKETQLLGHRKSDGTFWYESINKTESTIDNIKNEIKSGIISSLFEGGVVKQRIIDAFDSKNGKYSIEDNVISFVTKEGNISLIKYDSGTKVAEFVTDDIRLLKEMYAFLGLTNMSLAAVTSIFEGKEEGMQEELGKYFDVKEGYTAKNMLAKGFMAMFFSLEANNQVTNRIIKEQETLLDHKEKRNSATGVDSKAFHSKKIVEAESRIRQAEKNYIHETFLNEFLKDQHITKVLIDGQAEALKEEGQEVTLSYKTIKPTDFFEFLRFLGVAEDYKRGTGGNQFTFSLDGKKQQLWVPASFIFHGFRDGSSIIVENYKAEIDNALQKKDDPIVKDQLRYTPFYDFQTKKTFNLILDGTIDLLELRDYSSIGIQDGKGSSTPNEYDLISMAFYPFLEEMKSGRQVRHVPMILTNIADTGNVIQGKFSFGNTKLISFHMDKGYQILKGSPIKLTGEAIWTKGVRSEFERRHRAFLITKQKWIDFGLANDFGSLIDLSELARRETPLETMNYLNGELKRIRTDALKGKNAELYKKFYEELNKTLNHKADFFYNIKDDNYLVPEITAGMALNFTVANNIVYNYDNYINHVKGKILSTANRDLMFTDCYKAFAKALGDTQWQMPSDVKGLLDNNGYYQMIKDKDGKEQMLWNPVMKAFFYTYDITNSALMPLIQGSDYMFTNSIEKSKATGPLNTGYTKINPSPLGVGTQMLVIKKQDLLKTYKIGNENIVHPEADGEGRGSALAKLRINVSAGAELGFLHEDGSQKPITNIVDAFTGKVLQLKQAVIYITAQTYANFPADRWQQDMMLQHTDEVVRKIAEERGIAYRGLYQVFKDAYTRVGFNQAMQETSDWIVDHELSDEIQNNLVWQVVNQTASKVSGSEINHYDPLIHDGAGLVHTTVPSNNIGFVLNPHQDILDYKDLAPFSQQMSYIGALSPSLADKASKVYDLNQELFFLAKDEIDKEISGGVELNEEEFYTKFMDFLRDRGYKILKEMGSVEAITELLTNKKISLQLPHVKQLLDDSYKSYITRKAMKVGYNGLRMVQASGENCPVLWKDNNRYMLSEIEKELGREITRTEFAVGKFGDYTIRRLAYIEAKEDGNTRMEVYAPYLYKDQFGIKEGETINDVFTVVMKNGEKHNFRNRTGEEVRTFINENLDDIDHSKSPIVRGVYSEKIAINSFADYVDNFKKSLYIFSSRVPAGLPGAGGIAEIVGFIDDNANTIYVPIEMTILNDSDFDIDQLSVYFRFVVDGQVPINTISKEGILNTVLDHVDDIFSDSSINPNYFISSNTKYLTDQINKGEIKGEYTRPYAFATTLEEYKTNRAGATSIPVAAINTSTIGILMYLARTNGDVIKELEEFVAAIDVQGLENPLVLSSNYLQSVLDNKKTLVVGSLGIPATGFNVALSMAGFHRKNVDYIKGFFSKQIVKDIFATVERGESVEQSAYKNRLFLVLNDFINNEVVNYNRKFDILIKQQGLEKNTLFDLKAAKTKLEIEAKTWHDKVGDIDPNVDFALQEKSDEYKADIKQLGDVIDLAESVSILKELEQYAIEAETIRRIAHFIGVRNGLRTREGFENWIYNGNLYVGQDLSVLLKGEKFLPGQLEMGELEYDVKVHVDYYKNNSNDFFREGNRGIQDYLVGIEERIASQVDIPGLIEALPQIKTGVYSYVLEDRRDKEIWLDKNEFTTGVRDQYLIDQYLHFWDFDSRKNAFYRASWQSYIDQYFKDNFADIWFNIAVPDFIVDLLNDEGGHWSIGQTLFNNINLSSAVDRLHFSKQMVRYAKFLQDVSIADVVVGKAMVKAHWEKDFSRTNNKYFDKMAEDFVMGLKNNPFIQRLYITGMPGSETIRFKDGAHIDDGVTRELRRHFERLPLDIQTKFRLYQFATFGFRHVTGSLSDVVGLESYYKNNKMQGNGISETFEQFRYDMKNNSDLVAAKLEKLEDELRLWLPHQNGLSNFLSKKDYDNGITPRTILSNVKIREGLNVQKVKRYLPFASEKDSRGYALEYYVGGRGNQFDNERSLITDIETINNFTAEQLDELNKGSQVTIKLIHGHGYRQTYSIATDEAGVNKIEDKLYIISGTIAKVTSFSQTKVTFQKVEVDIGVYEQRKMDEMIRNQSMADQRTKDNLTKKNAGLETIYTPLHNLGGTLTGVVSSGKKHGIKVNTVRVKEFDDLKKELVEFRKITNENEKERKFYSLLFKLNEKVLRSGRPIVILADKGTPDLKYLNIITNRVSSAVPRIINPTAEELRVFIAHYDVKKLTVIGQNAKSVRDAQIKTELLFNEAFGERHGEGNKDLSMLSYMALEGRRIDQKGFDALLAQLKTSVKGINFIEETNETVADMIQDRSVPGLSNDVRAWVDNDGIHFNVDKIRSGDGVHEIAHIWNVIMEKDNPDLFNFMYGEAEKMIEKNDPIANAVKRQYKHLTGRKLVLEMMSTIAGFSSVESVNNWLLNHNSIEAAENPNLAKGLWGTIKGWLDKINTWFKDLLSKSFNVPVDLDFDYSTTTLEDIYKRVTEYLLSGGKLIDATEGNTQKFVNAYMNSLGGHRIDASVHLGEKPPIKITRNLHVYLNNNSDEIKSIDQLSEGVYGDQRRLVINDLMKQISNNPTWNEDLKRNTYSYVIGNKPYVFTQAEIDNESVFREKVSEELFPDVMTREGSFKPNVISVMRLMKEGKELADALKEVFPEQEYHNETVWRDFIKKAGFDEGYVRLAEYKTLVKDPEYKGLFKDDLMGYNPLVIIHSESEKELDISLIDVTPRRLDLSGSAMRGTTLVSNFMKDSKYAGIARDSQIEVMSNSDFDVRKIMLGISLMNIGKHKRVRVRNMGVYQFNYNSFNSFPVKAISSLIKNVQVLSEIPELVDNIENLELKSLLQDSELYGKDYQQSYVARVIASLTSIKVGIPTYKLQNWNSYLLGPDVTIADQKKVLRQIQSEYCRKQDNPEDQKVYQMVSAALMELEGLEFKDYGSISEMEGLSKYMVTAHNVESPVLQYAVQQTVIAKNRTVEEFMQYHNKIRPLLDDVIALYEGKHGLKRLSKYGKDIGSQYFAHLYKEVDAELGYDYNDKLIKGKKVKIKSPLLHYTMEDKETAALVRARIIDPIELKFTSMILDILKEQEIDNILHIALQNSLNKDERGNPTYTRQDAIEQFGKTYTKGSLPVMPKNINELVWKGNFIDAFHKMTGEVINPSFLFEDQLGNSKVKDRISGSLITQESYEKKLEKMGIKYQGGKNIIFDYDATLKISTNIENTMNYFMLGSYKKVNYETLAMPAWNDAKMILNLLDKSQEKLSQKENREWLNSWMNRIVLGKTNDPKTHFWIGNTKVEHRKVIRGLLRMTTFLALGYRVTIGLRSFTFNTLRLIIEPLANTIADMGIKEGAEVATLLPKSSDMMKAVKYMFTDFKKMRHLAYKYQLIDRSERDVLNSIFVKETYKNMLSSQVAHIMNWATDAWARMLGMTAMMVKAGTWDAHVYNEKTDTSIFDITKDKRYRDENGNFKSKEAKTLYDALKHRMVEQGILKSIDQKMDRGYDYVLSNNLLKWYSDKFIIGGMDDLSKGIASNHFIGAMLSQYRMFSFERLHNAGLFAHERKVGTGIGYKAFKDENGNWVSKKELQDIEGMYQSVMSSFRYLLNRKKLTPKQWWMEQHPIRRMNIAKACLHVAFVAILIGILKQFVDKDEEDRYNWLVNDVILVFETPGFFASPMPAVDLVIKLFNVGVGQKNVNTLMRWTGPVYGAQEVIEFGSGLLDPDEEEGTF